jgi:molybdopterin-guanine dinucleotide biosynthesis protein A
MSPPDAMGALLAGGSGTRMGRPKADVQLGGRSLAQRTCHTLAQFTVEVIQVGGQPIADLRRRHLPDARPGAGPAAGIEVALSDAGIHVVALALDLPFVPPALLLATLEVVDQGAAICAPRWDQRWHPLCAAYSATALISLQERLDRGALDLHGLLDEIGTPIEGSEFGDPTKMLLNINTPEDLARAEKLLADQ